MDGKETQAKAKQSVERALVLSACAKEMVACPYARDLDGFGLVGCIYGIERIGAIFVYDFLGDLLGIGRKQLPKCIDSNTEVESRCVVGDFDILFSNLRFVEDSTSA